VAKPDWKAFDLQAEIQKQVDSGRPYNEFLRSPELSCGIYSLPAGSKDLQSRHDEDEVYYVLSGRARLRIDDREVSAEAGSILYVRATSEHSFIEIEEDVTLLVFFASGGPSGPED